MIYSKNLKKVRPKKKVGLWERINYEGCATYLDNLDSVRFSELLRGIRREEERHREQRATLHDRMVSHWEHISRESENETL